MNHAAFNGWKYYLGLGLLGVSVAALAAAAVAPVLFAPGTAAAIVTGVLVVGEVGFWTGAALVGKPVYDGMKAKLKAWFVGPTASLSRSVGGRLSSNGSRTV